MNILAIGAHFDDIELGCSGTLIKHVESGDNVTMLVITDSAFTNPDNIEIRNREIAKCEGEAGALVIGANLICLDYKTFNVSFDDKL